MTISKAIKVWHINSDEAHLKLSMESFLNMLNSKARWKFSMESFLKFTGQQGHLLAFNVFFLEQVFEVSKVVSSVFEVAPPSLNSKFGVKI